MTPHAQYYRMRLEDIARYSTKSLEILYDEEAPGISWVYDLASTQARLCDVARSLRDQTSRGVRYGNNENADVAAILREVADCANNAISYMENDAGIFPAWVENSISLCAMAMESLFSRLHGHGRKYGTFLNPVPGDAGDVALYRGRADGIEGNHKNPYSPNDFQHGIYEQGFAEGYGTAAPARRRLNISPILYVGGGHDHGHGRGHGHRCRHHGGHHRGRRMAGEPTIRPTELEWMMPPNRMTEPHRMGMLHRQFGPPFARIYGKNEISKVRRNKGK